MELPLTKFQLTLVILLIMIWVALFATTVWSPTTLPVSDAPMADQMDDDGGSGFNNITVDVVGSQSETDAEVVVSTEQASLGVGEQTEVSVSISNPDGDMISAYQVFVTFDPELVEVLSIADGAVYDTDQGWQNLITTSNETQVRVAGVTLGEGSSDPLIEVARFTVRSKAPGEAVFMVETDTATGKTNDVILNEKTVTLSTGSYAAVDVE